MLVLGASIVLPILLLLGTIVSDAGKQIATARAELAGLVTVQSLTTLFADTSARERTVACGTGGGSSAAMLRDAATLDRIERAHPLGGSDWNAVATDVRGAHGDLAPLIDEIATLFPSIADRSRLTYDPDFGGIDLADSLTYRLPIAIEQLEAADRTLCRSGASAIAARLALSQSTGHASGYLSDGLSETLEATKIDPGPGRLVRADQSTTATVTSDAQRDIALFERIPDARNRARAQATTASSIRDLYVLMRATIPALHEMIEDRERALVRRRSETLLLGVTAILAALAIVMFGARSALQRAELARMRRTSVELEYHANHDRLTGLPNRAAFVSAIERHLERADAIGILFIDLDHFKLINDSYGHEAGDAVLSAVSRRLERLVPASGIVARFGGDEFAMLLSDASPATVRGEVDRLAEIVIAEMGAALEIGGPVEKRLVISASVGTAVVENDGRRPYVSADILRDADAAMYEAKAAGRARAETFGPAMHERAVRKLTLMNDLAGVTTRGELELEFQRFVDLERGICVGSEALLRWRHPKIGLLMPGAFIPIAEESGSLVSLGRWAFEDAVARFANRTAPEGTLHVNVSVRELLENDLDTTVEQLLERYDVAPESLAIEVIEGSLIRSGDRAEQMLRRLRALGIKIWIDDFGVEYSSLRYLHRLPIDGVKIDRTFVGGADGALASPAIVRLIIELAGSLGLGVVAEGIETVRQRDELVALGCVLGQGYLFDRASPDALSNSSPAA
jgi:diguanylate cyclase (GGDEF)-like protein